MKSLPGFDTQSIESPESLIGFEQYWLILRRRWLPASVTFGAVLLIATLYAFLATPIYQAEGMLRFKKRDATTSLTDVGRDIGQLAPLVEQGNPLDTEAVVLRSNPIVQKTINTLDLKNDKGASLKPREFKKQLSVSNVQGADVLQVSYKDPNPQTAAAVVNTLIGIYLKNGRGANRAEAVETRKFIEKQLPGTEARTRQAEVAVRDFKEKNNVVDLAQESTSAVEAITDLENQVTQAEAELAKANAQTEELQKKAGMNSQAAISASSLSQSPAVQKALEELQEVERELAVQRTRYQDSHPIIADLKDRQATLKSLLKGRVGQVVGGQKQQSSAKLQIGEQKQNLIDGLVNSEVTRLGIARQVSALSKAKAAYEKRIDNIPKLEQELRELERRREAAQSTYEALLNKLQEARIAENETVNNARIIEAALVPEQPAAPRKSLLLVTGGLLGLLLSIATALILEARDKSLRSVEVAREIFGLPLLGVVPVLKEAKKIPLLNGGSGRSSLEMNGSSLAAPVNPRFRMLQASLGFLANDKDLKIVVVTSSVPKEGKSTVSANLAASMAQQGRRVLLVDGDMHHPAQHQTWELPNDLGLGNILTNQVNFKDAVQRIQANLDVLTTGATSSNPAALFNSQLMTSLVEHFSSTYDFVIVDTPPLMVGDDALVLGKMADGVLLVVQPEVVDQDSAMLAKGFLELSGLRILGLVINGVMREHKSYSYPHTGNKLLTSAVGNGSNPLS